MKYYEQHFFDAMARLFSSKEIVAGIRSFLKLPFGFLFGDFVNRHSLPIISNILSIFTPVLALSI
jgi:hypothetical protein